MLIRFLGNALKSSPLSSCIFFCSRVYLPSAFVRTWLNLCVSRCYAWNAGCIRSISSVGGEWDLALIPRGEASGSVAAGSWRLRRLCRCQRRSGGFGGVGGVCGCTSGAAQRGSRFRARARHRSGLCWMCGPRWNTRPSAGASRWAAYSHLNKLIKCQFHAKAGILFCKLFF